MDDVTRLTQLVLRERQGRDLGRWQRMRDAWESDGRVMISWIDGTAEEFIAGSIRMSGSGLRATHRMSPPVVDVVGDRAVVDAPTVIEVRTLLAGMEIDLASRARLLFRARRHADDWLLHSMTCVYDSDAITPTSPSAVTFRGADGARASYRWLTTVLAAGGHHIAGHLPGVDWPETVDAVEHDHTTWLHGGTE